MLANVAAGRADTPHMTRGQALTQLAHLVKTLLEDQRDPTLSAEGLLSNFLDLSGGKRLGPLASNIEKSKFVEAFGPAKGEATLESPHRDRLAGSPARTARRPTSPGANSTATSTSKAPSPPSTTPPPGRKILAILDARVVMIVFGDNANLSASAAKTIGALLSDSEVKEKPGVAAIRDELERFLEASSPATPASSTPRRACSYFGWDAPRNRFYGWDDLLGNRTVGHMDYLVNEFRGPATFVAARFGLPTASIANLGFKMKPYRLADGRDLNVLAPWEGSAFQALGLGLCLGEMGRPSWRALLTDAVDVELDYANRHALPGFLSESYTGEGTQYSGRVGIPEITVSPRPRITDAASLYTLGVAYSIAPARVEELLAANWAIISKLITDHGPWEGYNTTQKGPIAIQTTAHTLSLVLGLIGRGSDDMARYLESKGLADRLDPYFEVGPGVDLLAHSPAFAWTAKGSTLASGKEGSSFHVKGDQLGQFGVAFVPEDPRGVNLSGGLLTLRYRSSQALEPVSIELKPVKPPTNDSGLIPRAITARFAATGDGEGEIRVPLPSTPGLGSIKEVVIFHERAAKGPVDLTITHLSVAPIR